MRGFTKTSKSALKVILKRVFIFSTGQDDEVKMIQVGSAGCRVERRTGSKKKLQQGDCSKSDLWTMITLKRIMAIIRWITKALIEAIAGLLPAIADPFVYTVNAIGLASFWLPCWLFCWLVCACWWLLLLSNRNSTYRLSALNCTVAENSVPLVEIIPSR